MKAKPKLLALWLAAVLAATLAFVVHLTLRFETVRLGYELSKARQEERRLYEMRRLLAIEGATLRQNARIEAIARGKLGMTSPEPSRVVNMGALSKTKVVEKSP